MLFFFGIFVCNDIQSNKMLILSILLYSITRCVYNTNDVTIWIGRVGRWLLMMAKVMGIVSLLNRNFYCLKLLSDF